MGHWKTGLGTKTLLIISCSRIFFYSCHFSQVILPEGKKFDFQSYFLTLKGPPWQGQFSNICRWWTPPGTEIPQLGNSVLTVCSHPSSHCTATIEDVCSPHGDILLSNLLLSWWLACRVGAFSSINSSCSEKTWPQLWWGCCVVCWYEFYE